MMASLRELDGPQKGQLHKIVGVEHIVGRELTQCHMVLDLQAVSRRHFRIIKQNDTYLIEDLGSTNKTHLNDEELPPRQPRPLKDGDVIGVCTPPYPFSFVFVDDVKQPASPPLGNQPLRWSREVDDASAAVAAELIDDETNPSSTIMKQIDIKSSDFMSSSPEAKLEAVIEITRALAGKLALDDVLPQVIATLFRIFPQADRGYVVMRNAEGALVPKWSRTRRPDQAETIRISRTITGNVMTQKQAILSADAASDSRFEMSESIADFRIRSLMCAPLLDSNGEAIGTLQIDTLDQRKRFREDDLDVLAAVASQAGIIIDNARMHEVAVKQASIQKDLEIAVDVQKGFLPANSPAVSPYLFHHYYLAANKIGGDYFDYIRLQDGRYAIVVADVVGHGIAAALMMAQLSAQTRYQMVTQSEPGAALTQLNRVLANLPLDRFITLVMAVLDPQRHEITIANAGHMNPMIRRQDGTIEEPGEDQSGTPLTVDEDWEYETLTIPIYPGDVVVLYTDGVNEAMNEHGDEFGMDRMRQLVMAMTPDPHAIGHGLIQKVLEFQGAADQYDDMCLVAFGYPVEVPTVPFGGGALGSGASAT